MALAGNQQLNDLVDSDHVSATTEPGLDSAHDIAERSVLMFSYTFPPAAAAGIFRTLRFMRYLPEFGWAPLILTVKPESLHHDRIDNDLNEWIPAGAIVERTSVLQPFKRAAKLLTPRSRSNTSQSTSLENHRNATDKVGVTHYLRLRKLLSAIARVIKAPFTIPDAQIGWAIPAVWAAIRMVRAHRPSVLYSSGPPHSSHLIAALVKSMTGLPLIIDLRDPWAYCDWNRDESYFHSKIQRWLERFSVRRSDAVLLNTVSLREQFCQNYPAELHKRFVTITNGYDPELRRRIAEIQKSASQNTRSNDRAVFRLCHAGTVYGERHLQPVVKAIASLNQMGVPVVLEQIGMVADEQELREFIRDHCAERYVQLLGRQPHQLTLKLMAEADALIVLQPGTTIQVPGKLYEMLPFRKPILALTGSGETADIVTKYLLGVVACPDNFNELTCAIQSLSEQLTNYDYSGWAKAMQQFEGRNLTGDLAAVLVSVLNEQQLSTPSRSAKNFAFSSMFSRLSIPTT